jgi:AcrR family transcriptional regulator
VTLQGAKVRPLPKGPHRLSREEVQASQRERMLRAVLEAVGEHGYERATVAHVTSAAHVSRSAFYEQFADKRDAFLAAYEEFGRQFFGELVAVAARAATPVETIRTCGDLLVEWGRSRPIAARAFLLEVYAAGEEGLRRRDRIMRIGEGVFEQAAAWVRRLDPSLPDSPPLIGRAVIAASFELAAQGLRAGNRKQGLEAAKDAIEHIWLLALTGREQIS